MCTPSIQDVGPQVEWLEDTHSATQRNPSFHVSILMGWSRYGESGRQKYMYWCMYTFYTSHGNRNKVNWTQNHCHTGAPMFPCNYANQFELTLEFRWTCIPIQMHIHILTKVYNQMSGECNTHSAKQRNPSFHVTRHNGMEQTWGVRWTIIHVVMQVHILHKMWQQKWDDCNIHSATHWNPSFHVTMHRGWRRIQNSGWHKYMYWCMYTF